MVLATSLGKETAPLLARSSFRSLIIQIISYSNILQLYQWRLHHHQIFFFCLSSTLFRRSTSLPALIEIRSCTSFCASTNRRIHSTARSTDHLVPFQLWSGLASDADHHWFLPLQKHSTNFTIDGSSRRKLDCSFRQFLFHHISSRHTKLLMQHPRSAQLRVNWSSQNERHHHQQLQLFKMH